MKKTALWVLGIIILLLIVVRLAAPTLIKDQINQAIAGMPDYTGEVGDVSLSVFRGVVAVNDIRLKHMDGSTNVNVESFATNIQWVPLLHRQLVCTLTIRRPRITMAVQQPTEAAKKAKEEAEKAAEKAKAETGYASIPSMLRNLIPFRIDAIYLADGSAKATIIPDGNVEETKKDLAKHNQKDLPEDKGKLPEFHASDINMTITNLTNSRKLSDTLAAGGEASAKVMDSGTFDMKLHLNPLAEKPQFQLATDIKNLDLRELNPLLRQQTGIDVHKGIFSMYSEASAADGAFKGYVKPLIKDLDVVNLKKEKNLVKIAKEAVVGAVAKVLKNPETEAVALQVPIQGTFDDPAIGIIPAVVTVLRNSFTEALRPRFDKNFKPNPKTPMERPSA